MLSTPGSSSVADHPELPSQGDHGRRRARASIGIVLLLASLVLVVLFVTELVLEGRDMVQRYPSTDDPTFAQAVDALPRSLAFHQEERREPECAGSVRTPAEVMGTVELVSDDWRSGFQQYSATLTAKGWTAKSASPIEVLHLEHRSVEGWVYAAVVEVDAAGYRLRVRGDGSGVC